MRYRREFVFLVVAALLTTLSLQAQWKTRWEYEGARGADHWSELDPAYASCNTGKEQSPIDIEGSEKAALPPLRFESKSGPLKYLVNNGHTIRVNYHDAAGTGDLLIVGEETYQLTQFHFHRPSEEYIHGKVYDMVAHLMYQSVVSYLCVAGFYSSAVASTMQTTASLIAERCNCEFISRQVSKIQKATPDVISFIHLTYLVGSENANKLAEKLGLAAIIPPPDPSRSTGGQSIPVPLPE